MYKHAQGKGHLGGAPRRHAWLINTSARPFIPQRAGAPVSVLRRLCAACLAALLLCVHHAGRAQTLYLVTGNAAPFTTAGKDGFFDLVAAELSRRTGTQLEVRRHKSSARALINADRGEDDGVIARMRGMERPHPNLVMVPEPLFHNDFVACTLGAAPAPRARMSLASRRVGYIRGWRVFETVAPAQAQVTRVRDAAQLFELLRLGRIDVALYERWQALWYARHLGLPLRIAEPPLVRHEMFIYLHRRHADLVPRAAAALARMKRDGAYGRIFQATLGVLSAGALP